MCDRQRKGRKTKTSKNDRRNFVTSQGKIQTFPLLSPYPLLPRFITPLRFSPKALRHPFRWGIQTKRNGQEEKVEGDRERDKEIG
jgi:hypothetical protein